MADNFTKARSFTCATCGHKTRTQFKYDDNHGSDCCRACWDLQGEVNYVSDNGVTKENISDSDKARIVEYASVIRAQGGREEAYADFLQQLGITLPGAKAKKVNTGDMSKVSGVWLKPTIAKDEQAAADLAFDGVRRRPVIAKNQKGELVVCSMRTARKHGWAVEGKLDGTAARTAPAKKGEAKRKERLAKLDAVAPAKASKKAAKPMEATAKDQWAEIAAKAAKAGTKGKKAAAALADMLGE